MIDLSDDAVERAVRDLAGTGLLHRPGDDEFVRPTRAAIRFFELERGEAGAETTTLRASDRVSSREQKAAQAPEKARAGTPCGDSPRAEQYSCSEVPPAE